MVYKKKKCIDYAKIKNNLLITICVLKENVE